MNNEPFSGLIISDNPELEYGSPIETRKGEKFFSIYSKPNPEDIMGGYWGYCRDKKVVENGITSRVLSPKVHQKTIRPLDYPLVFAKSLQLPSFQSQKLREAILQSLNRNFPKFFQAKALLSVKFARQLA